MKRGMANRITEEERERIIELSKAHSIIEICRATGRARGTIFTILYGKKKNPEPKTLKGFFNVDEYAKSLIY